MARPDVAPAGHKVEIVREDWGHRLVVDGRALPEAELCRLLPPLHQPLRGHDGRFYVRDRAVFAARALERALAKENR